MTENERKQFTATVDKRQARRVALDRRARIESRADKQCLLTERLLTLTAAYRTVFCYVSMGSEVATHAYLRRAAERQTVTVPFTEGAQMSVWVPDLTVDLTPDRNGNVAGQPYGGAVDVAVVPLAAFNTDCHRIGYGKGCYDRWLSAHLIPTIGLAFDEQEANFLPEPHDVPLDCILTPTRLIKKNRVEECV